MALFNTKIMKQTNESIYKESKSSSPYHSVEQLAEAAHDHADDNENKRWINNETLAAIASFILLGTG